MIRESVKSFLTGTARGAVAGALIGFALLGGGAALGYLALSGLSWGAVLTTPIAFVAGGLSLSATPLGPVFIGGCAAISACYKGISDFVDMEETIQQKQEMVEVAHTQNAIAKSVATPSLRPQQNFVPEHVPDVAKDEMPKEWVKAENIRRVQAAQETERGIS